MDSLQVVQLFSIIASALFGISLPIFNSKAKTEQQKSRNATIAATGAAVGFLFSASSTIISNSIAKDSRSIQQAEKVLLKREKDSLSDVIRKIYLTADSAKSGISTANSKIAKSQETADSIIARMITQVKMQANVLQSVTSIASESKKINSSLLDNNHPLVAPGLKLFLRGEYYPGNPNYKFFKKIFLDAEQLIANNVAIKDPGNSTVQFSDFCWGRLTGASRNHLTEINVELTVRDSFTKNFPRFPDGAVLLIDKKPTQSACQLAYPGFGNDSSLSQIDIIWGPQTPNQQFGTGYSEIASKKLQLRRGYSDSSISVSYDVHLNTDFDAGGNKMTYKSVLSLENTWWDIQVFGNTPGLKLNSAEVTFGIHSPDRFVLTNFDGTNIEKCRKFRLDKIRDENGFVYLTPINPD